MKFVAAVLTLAAVATAAPAEVVARTNPPTGGTCNLTGNNDGHVTCCGGLLGGLLCNVLAIGSTCNSGQSVYCCNSSQSGLINIGLLNCVDLL
ncbi:hypothetical protein MGU_09745 [Metarhizium guizhouense ARSEF 977]|uniref:Hydrophobin n=1 Tax=Metarhizium guizhouense (strain ARSEF 977) TaxID=1276136 RepID=A0A0B4GKB6_METGA|nr:hypothetical protein MGU_09745 [Metarhizium guizhouense ARSEF 977]